MSMSVVTLTRRFNSTQHENNDMADGAMRFATSLPSARSVRILPGGQAVVTHTDSIDLGEGLSLRVIDCVTALDDGVETLKSLRFEVSSETLDINATTYDIEVSWINPRQRFILVSEEFALEFTKALDEELGPETLIDLRCTVTETALNRKMDGSIVFE